MLSFIFSLNFGRVVEVIMALFFHGHIKSISADGMRAVQALTIIDFLIQLYEIEEQRDIRILTL